MIALAIACRPTLLIADEPTTALDSTVQAQILELIATLSGELDMATILITHNLGIVAGLCDRVAVMYGGRIVETATRDGVVRRSTPSLHARPAALRAARRSDHAWRVRRASRASRPMLSVGCPAARSRRAAPTRPSGAASRSRC